MKYVEVSWVDAHAVGDQEWLQPGQLDIGCDVTTVGVLYQKTKRWLVVAGSVTEHGAIGDVIAIPRACVRKLRTLT